MLEAWGVTEGDRIVFYDDYGLNRQAIRGYWLLRLYRYLAARLAVLDGGLTAWRRAGGALTREDVPPPTRHGERPSIGPLDPGLIATTAEVQEWSTEAVRPGGPTRVLDVRSGDEYLGDDVRAARGGHVPGARHRLFSDFVRADGTLRSPDEAIRLLHAVGVEPEELRVTYCQGGVRATLPWFILHELGGLEQVRSYAGSWEEWGNRADTPVER